MLQMVKPPMYAVLRPRAAVLLSLLVCVIAVSAPKLTHGAESLSERVEAAVLRAAARPLQREAAGVDRVAAWAARAAFGGSVDAAATRHQLWIEGARDFEFRPLSVVARGLDPVAALERALADPTIRWPRYTHFALSVLEGTGRTAVSVILTRQAVRFTEGLEQGSLVFTLLDGLRQPALYVTRPDGSVERFEARSRSGAWIVEWDPGTVRGELLLEVVAEGARGPEIVALWREKVLDARPLSTASGDLPDPNAPFQEDSPPAWDPYQDQAPPSARGGSWLVGSEPPPDRSPTSADAQQAEDHLWQLIQNARVARGLPRLERHVGMTRAARQHAGELARGESFGHHTSSGTALDRLTAQGVAASRATENVAVAAHVAEAHAALMASPAHRANLLDAGVGAGAVGVVLQKDARGRWSATASEVFAKLLPEGGAEQWGVLALDAINRSRQTHGLEVVRTRDRLQTIAQEGAQAVVDSGVLELPRDDRSALVDRVRFHFNAVRRVSVDLIVTPEPARAAQLAHAIEREFDEVGIGVVTLPEAVGGHAAGTPLLLLLFVQR